jgi:hypothetical protein
MCLAEKLFSEDALRHAVLARDHHYFVTGAIQQPNCVEGIREKLQTLEPVEIADIFYQRPVAIDEDGRVLHACVS